MIERRERRRKYLVISDGMNGGTVPADFEKSDTTTVMCQASLHAKCRIQAKTRTVLDKL